MPAPSIKNKLYQKDAIKGGLGVNDPNAVNKNTNPETGMAGGLSPMPVGEKKYDQANAINTSLPFHKAQP